MRLSWIVWIGPKHNNKCSYKRKVEGNLTNTHRGNVTGGGVGAQLERCGQKPRNASSHQKLENASNGLCPGAFIRNQNHWYPDFGLLASRNVDQASAILSLQAMAPCYSNHRKLIECCINFLLLPQQSTTNWVTQATEIYFHTVWRPEVQDQGISRAGSHWGLWWRSPASGGFLASLGIL